jgi:hypothetical protein
MNCPWDERICRQAAINGNIKLLQWARKEGCPWDETTCEAAAANGQFQSKK